MISDEVKKRVRHTILLWVRRDLKRDGVWKEKVGQEFIRVLGLYRVCIIIADEQGLFAYQLIIRQATKYFKEQHEAQRGSKEVALFELDELDFWSIVSDDAKILHSQLRPSLLDRWQERRPFIEHAFTFGGVLNVPAKF